MDSSRLADCEHDVSLDHFNEFTGEYLKRSEAYAAIETYLSTKSSSEAKNLKAVVIKDSTQPVQLSMDENEEVEDIFEGVKLWWTVKKNAPRTQSFSFYPEMEEKRFYKLTFHKSHRDFVCKTYISHVLQQGKAITLKNRQRKLCTNNPRQKWHGQRMKKKEKEKDEDTKDPVSKITKGEEESGSKVLAKNYLDVDSHHLFATIGHTLEETKMTPADVAENLMPKSLNEDAETCLEKLIEAIKRAKEDAIKKAEEEELLKGEKEEKEKKDAAEKDVKVDESLAKEVKENGVEAVKDDKGIN
ncbi:AAA-ATPase ASD, mitochondrial-like [Fagus crenata]